MAQTDQNVAEMVPRASGLLAPAVPSSVERVSELETKLARARDALGVLFVTYPSGYNTELRKLLAEVLRETKPR